MEDKPSGSPPAPAKRYLLKASAAALPAGLSISYETELNQQQLAAVTNIDGPQLVIAGAGSGKTRTLIYRLAYLVERGLDPRSVLLLTFTRKAAQEMMRRAAALLDERCARVRGGTFHSFANSTLRRFAARIGYSPGFTIVDRGDAEDIIGLLRTELGLASGDRRFPKKSTILELFSKAVNTGRELGDLLLRDYPNYVEEEDTLTALRRRYDEYKREKSIMDYDDLLTNLYRLLEENDDLRGRLSTESCYVMIDEYQDTNHLQSEIARLLVSAHGNVMAVGDDSQSIYAFRGADFRNIMDFPRMFPGTVITKLEQNYRSTQPILSLANALIETASEKYHKCLFTDISGEEKPVFVRARSVDEQASFIAQRVLELREEGVPLNDIAVLFRSAWQSNELEVELASRNIPFVKYGGLKFIHAAHVKDVVAFLRIVQNPNDAIGWHRLLLLLEGVGPKTAQNVVRAIIEERGGYEALIAPASAKKKYSGELRSLYQTLSLARAEGTSPSDKLEVVMKYYTPLLKRHYDDYIKRLNDLQSLVHLAERYNALEEFLSDISLEPPEDSQIGASAVTEDEEKLILSTIHSAKGLEWHSVFLISLIDGYIPSSQSLGDAQEVEEERRLLYVGITRAKRNLYLLVPQFANTHGFSYFSSGFSFSLPSRFLREIHDFEYYVEAWHLDSEEDFRGL